jgi:quercetin dioxygenase-like cupin family protein
VKHPALVICACVTIGSGVVGVNQDRLLAQQGPGEASREEYKSSAKIQHLLRDDLTAIVGKEATIQAAELAPGWVGERHFHTGDVFVYIQEGRFIVDVSGEGEKTFEAGQVYHEAVNTVMQARNGAKDKVTKLLVFQVGGKGEPLMLKAQ